MVLIELNGIQKTVTADQLIENLKAGEKIVFKISEGVEFKSDLFGVNSEDVKIEFSNPDGSIFSIILKGMGDLLANNVDGIELLDILRINENGQSSGELLASFTDLSSSAAASSATGTSGQNHNSNKFEEPDNLLDNDNNNFDTGKQDAGSTTAGASIFNNGSGDLTIDGDIADFVIEDGDTLATGDLSLLTEDNVSKDFKVDTIDGTYGTFTINAAGNWTYDLDADDGSENGNSVQSLSSGQVVTETFTVSSEDGTAIQDIILTISGTNDKPLINDIIVLNKPFWNLISEGASLETIEALNDISISNESSTPTNGSAVKFIVVTLENDTVSFNWDFFDAEYNSKYNDFSFVIVDGVLKTLEDIIDINVKGNTLLNIDLSEGKHTITFGVMNSGDKAVDSSLNVEYISGGNIVDIQTVGNVSSEINKIYETKDETDVLGEEDTQNDGNNTFTGLLTVLDVDILDEHTFSVVSDSLVIDGALDSDSLQVINASDITVDTVQNPNGTWNYTIDGNFTALSLGESVTVSFKYVADDMKGFDGTDGVNENSVSQAKTITLTITGTNDQPIITEATASDVTENNLSGSIAEIVSDDDSNSSYTFVSETVNATIKSSVQSDGVNIVDNVKVTIDSNGNYLVSGDGIENLAEGDEVKISFGVRVNDGTFDFNGESGVSELKIVSLTIIGKNDQPIVENIELGIESKNNLDRFTNDGSSATFDNNSSNNYSQMDNATIPDYRVQKISDIQAEVMLETNIPSSNADWDGARIFLYKGETLTLTSNSGSNDYYLGIDDSDHSSGISDPVIGNFKWDVLSLTTQAGQSVSVTADADGWYYLGTGAIQGIDSPYGLYNTTVTITSKSEIKIYETNGKETIFSGKLEVSDLDTTDTHTFQLTSVPSVVTNSEAVITDLTVIVNENGSYLVDGNFDELAQGEEATVTFTYTATDDSKTSNSVSEEKIVSIIVTGTNDAPTVNTESYSGINEDSGWKNLDVLANDDDVDENHNIKNLEITSSSVEFVSTTANGLRVNDFKLEDLTKIIDKDDTKNDFLKFKPNSSFDKLATGEEVILKVNYTVADDLGASSEGYSLVTVVGTNDAPKVTVDKVKAFENDTKIVDVLKNDTDKDHNDNSSNFSIDSIGKFMIKDSHGNWIELDNSAIGIEIISDNSYSTQNKLEITLGDYFDYLPQGGKENVLIYYNMSDDEGLGQSNSKNYVNLTIIGTNDLPETSISVASEDTNNIDLSGLDFSKGFIFSADVKLDSGSNTFFRQQDDGSDTFLIEFGGSTMTDNSLNGYIQVYIPTNNGIIKFISNTALDYNDWHNIEVEYSNTNSIATIKIDGTDVTLTDVTSFGIMTEPNPYAGHEYTIGSTNNEQFNGEFKDVTITTIADDMSFTPDLTGNKVLYIADDIDGGNIDMHTLLTNVTITPNSLDEIDLSSGSHILSNISASDVFSITDGERLVINADSGDKIDLNLGSSITLDDVALGNSISTQNWHEVTDDSEDGLLYVSKDISGETVELLIKGISEIDII